MCSLCTLLQLTLCASPEKAQRHQLTCWPHTITFIYSKLVGQLAAPSLVPCLRDRFLRVCTSNRTSTVLSYCARFVSDLRGCVRVEAEVTCIGTARYHGLVCAISVATLHQYYVTRRLPMWIDTQRNLNKRMLSYDSQRGYCAGRTHSWLCSLFCLFRTQTFLLL
jgi:hypothetical protein